MVRAWVYSESNDESLRKNVSLNYLSKLGVLYWKIEPSRYQDDQVFNTVRLERNYKNHDIITVSPQTLPNYEEKIKIFFDEHIHDDEEIRFFLEGSGYFDVRDELTQNWIRIECVAGDLIVLPAGIYHRFTTDDQSFAKVMRLFQDEPKWTAYSRKIDSTGIREARTKYLESLQEFGEVYNGKAVILGDRAKALANYPHSRVVGNLVYFSGTSSRRPDNTHIGATLKEDGTWDLDIKLQTQAVFENIRWILQRSGSDLQHLISITVFLVDFKDFPGYNEVYNWYFDAETGPARTTIAVKRLPHPNLLLEIQGVAALAQTE